MNIQPVQFVVGVVEDTAAWPKLTTVQVVPAPAVWKLRDPKQADASGLLAAISPTQRSFTPYFMSGTWTLVAEDAFGNVMATYRLRLGDTEGWMTAPDWDDGSWTLWSPNAMITARSGQTITIADKTFPLPDDCDILYQPVDIPVGTVLETELYRPSVSGSDDQSRLSIGFAVDPTDPAFVHAGSGVQQSGVATQQAFDFWNNANQNAGGSHTDVRRSRAHWNLEGKRRAPALTVQSLRDDQSYYGLHWRPGGGMGFSAAPIRSFGLWVGRDGPGAGGPFTVSAIGRLRIT